jgi:hypothetical protein
VGECPRRHSPDLVIFDTISKLVAGEESKSDTWQDLYRYLLVPLRQTNCAALILDHQGHDASKGARGSSAKRDNVDPQWIQTWRDGVITLKRDKCRTLHDTETLKIRRGGTPLRHTTETDAVQDCMTFLRQHRIHGRSTGSRARAGRPQQALSEACARRSSPAAEGYPGNCPRCRITARAGQGMFSNCPTTTAHPAVWMRGLFALVNGYLFNTLPRCPLTAPTHTPLGVCAGRQLSRCRRAQKDETLRRGHD